MRRSRVVAYVTAAVTLAGAAALVAGDRMLLAVPGLAPLVGAVTAAVPGWVLFGAVFVALVALATWAWSE